ncbi:MAG: hypothetical protein OXR68_03725 [Alphaproteobacteria bacterium]|nr:hypothetical protein [Alphaproteobacteria bacterium]MDD9919716.1 hypothetical protein [Alphaproteobacteria bacterium]
MAATKKAPAKAKKTTTKATPKKSTKPTVEKRLDAIEARLKELEEHDITRKAEDAYKNVSEQVKESYAANPTMAIAIGLGVLLLILLLVG